MREPEWNEEEFVTLLRNLDKSDEELSRLTGRSVGAIGTVKAGLREYAKGKKNTSLLSDHMRDLLRGREHYLSFPVKHGSLSRWQLRLGVVSFILSVPVWGIVLGPPIEPEHGVGGFIGIFVVLPLVAVSGILAIIAIGTGLAALRGHSPERSRAILGIALALPGAALLARVVFATVAR